MCQEVKIYKISLELSLDLVTETNLLELGSSIWLSAFPTFELHTFYCKCFLFRTKIPCTSVLGHVG
jgi:hypothetical protein